MIDAGQDVIERILGRLHECLGDGGWWAVGHAESNTEATRTSAVSETRGALEETMALGAGWGTLKGVERD